MSWHAQYYWGCWIAKHYPICLPSQLDDPNAIEAIVKHMGIVI